MAAAVAAARSAQPGWAARTPVERGEVVRELALALQARRKEVAGIVVEETGKSLELALGEVDAAVEMGFFVAGEGRRLYGRTTTSAMPNRTVMATRRPIGVAGLIVSFNTPLPNYAWKVFPAVSLRQCCSAEAVGAHVRVGILVRASSAGSTCRKECSTSFTAWVRR